MKRFVILLAVIALAAVSCSPGRGSGNMEEQVDSVAVQAFSVENLPEEPVFDIVTNKGTIKVRLYSKTPQHRDNFVRLVNKKFYDSTLFHRVKKDFIIQGGDPYTRDTSKRDRWGYGGPGYTIPAEFVTEYYHKKGALAAARKGDMANPTKASNGSQFYLVQNEMNCLFLDGEYTVFGETIKGLDVIDRISFTPVDAYDKPLKDVVIITIKPDFATMERIRAEEETARKAADTLSAVPETGKPAGQGEKVRRSRKEKDSETNEENAEPEK